MPSLETFEHLANEAGLVRMQITQDFAPYSPDPDRGIPVAGFPPDVAHRIYGIKAGIPVDDDLNPIDLDEEAPPPAPVEASAVDIPDNWKDAHRLVKARIAKAIKGSNDKMSEQECDEVIAAEVERRRNANG